MGMVKMLCERDCTGDPIIKGQKVHKAYQQGRLYEIDPESSWAIHFRPVSSEEAANLEASRSEGVRPPEYLEPKVQEAPADDLFEKFRIG